MSVNTYGDTTTNRSPFVNLSVRHAVSNALMFSGNAYFRYIRADTVNPNLNATSADESVYQPTAADQAALAAAGYTGFPTSGANASNTPFPFWRCIGNVLLEDEPGEKCNGLLNRSELSQQNGGAFGQMTVRHSSTATSNQFTAGAGYDRSIAGFAQSTELGYLNPDRSVTGTGVFA